MKLRNLYLAVCLLLTIAKAGANTIAASVVSNGSKQIGLCGVACSQQDCRISSFSVKGCAWGKIKYISRKPDMLSINQDTGIFKALKLGEVTIDAIFSAAGCTGNGQVRSCTLNVLDGSPLPPLVPITKTYGDTPFDIDYPIDTQGNFTYTSNNPKVATVNGKKVTIKGAGKATITATKNRAISQDVPLKKVEAILTVHKAPQVLSFGADNPTSCTYGQPCQVVATSSSDSGLPIRYKVDDHLKKNCSVDQLNGKVTYKQADLCYIEAIQDGNANYRRGTAKPHRLEMYRAEPQITFTCSESQVKVNLNHNGGKLLKDQIFVWYRNSSDRSFVDYKHAVTESKSSENDSIINMIMTRHKDPRTSYLVLYEEDTNYRGTDALLQICTSK